MKLILSRKGRDSGPQGGSGHSFYAESGGFAWLPIPRSGEPVALREVPLAFLGYSRFETFNEDLPEAERLDPDQRIHYDPCLVDRAPRDFERGLGQLGASAGHLRNQDVGPGDLFLFFARFRKLRRGMDGLESVGEDCHALFGYLRVGSVRREPTPGDPVHHPHRFLWDETNNTIYHPRARLNGEGRLPDGSGCGMFSRLPTEGILTRPGGSLTDWELPRGFWVPGRGEQLLTYNRDPHRWNPPRPGGGVRLRASPRGQEFVLDLDHPELPSERRDNILSWVRRVLVAGTGGAGPLGTAG